MKQKWTQWLFYPFHYIAGLEALGLGLIFMALTVLAAYPSTLQFDGILDQHFTPANKLSVSSYALQQLLNLGIISLTLSLAGLFVRKSKFRFIDVIGTQALARAPFVLAASSGLLVSQESLLELSDPANLSNVGALFLANGPLIVYSIIALVATIWMVWLMYHAFSVSLNLQGRTAVIAFILSLTVAEILSKIAQVLI